MAQYDPIAIKAGIPTAIGIDTLRDDRIGVAGLTTTGLAAGDVVQVTSNLTLAKASYLLTSPVVGVYDGVSGSVVRKGIVVATFVSGLTLLNGDVVYLSSTAGQLTNVKPQYYCVHEVGVVVDATNKKILLQQKPVITLPGYVYVVSAYGDAISPSSSKATERYDESFATWTRLTDLNTARDYGIMVALSDGRVLLATGDVSGTPVSTCELLTGTSWAYTGTMARPHLQGRGCLLADGRVFITGGKIQSNNFDVNWISPIAEIWNPTTTAWSDTAAANTKRIRQTATLLLSGKVLVAGGMYYDAWDTYYYADGRVYDPVGNSWAATANSMATTRNNHAAVRLLDGRVLIIGGAVDTIAIASCSIYNSTTNQFSTTGSMGTPRMGHGAVLLTNGTVLVAGGRNASNTPLATAEIYDPDTGLWTATGSMTNTRYNVFNDIGTLGLFLLRNGKVIVPNCHNGTAAKAYDLFSAGIFTSPGNSLVTVGNATYPGVVF